MARAAFLALDKVKALLMLFYPVNIFVEPSAGSANISVSNLKV
jgi:hypothetical protein